MPKRLSSTERAFLVDAIRKLLVHMGEWKRTEPVRNDAEAVALYRLHRVTVQTKAGRRV